MKLKTTLTISVTVEHDEEYTVERLLSDVLHTVKAAANKWTPGTSTTTRLIAVRSEPA